MSLTKSTVRKIFREAGTEPDGDRRKKIAEHALASEALSRRKATLTLAQSEPGMAIRPDELDKNRWLLNVQNGTIDLKTGKLRAHDKADLITKIAPTIYHPDAECPTWVSSLWRIFAERPELIAFVKKLAGQFLTGDVSPQLLPIFHGTGANGKSTVVDALMNVLGGDYSMKAPPDFLMMKRGEHPTSMADLFGKRLVACVESGEGRRLNETLIKELTGGDRIRARRMREDFWEFEPTHKIVLATNHKPEVRGTDYAIWRRIRLIPFDVQIPPEERDPHLPEKLRAESAGILTWCVQGCLDWQREGLAAPDDVMMATNAYQGEQDVLGTFLDECCEVRPGASAKASDMLKVYREWSGERQFSQRRFGRAMTERGFDRYTNNGTFYLGVELTVSPQDAQVDIRFGNSQS